MIGSGIAVGYGVSSAELALGGFVARGVAARTGRGASVETIARMGLRVGDARALLGELDLSRFDAIVMTLGSDEAIRLASEKQFASNLSALLAWLAATASATRIVLVGVPDVTSILWVPKSIRGLIKRRCALLDAALRDVCPKWPLVTYLPFIPDAADLERDAGQRIYSAWAELIVPPLVSVLNAEAGHPRDPAVMLEVRRQLALDALGILDTPPEPRFDRIVHDARRIFGVKGASITFIDRERQWSKASVGMDALDSPRGSALGDATVNNGKLFVVEDASTDARFSGHPWVAGPTGIRFFAGFPIEAANGERVGALCLCDLESRHFSASDDAMLGILAGQVQQELWGTTPTNLR